MIQNFKPATFRWTMETSIHVSWHDSFIETRADAWMLSFVDKNVAFARKTWERQPSSAIGAENSPRRGKETRESVTTCAVLVIAIPWLQNRQFFGSCRLWFSPLVAHALLPPTNSGPSTQSSSSTPSGTQPESSLVSISWPSFLSLRLPTPRGTC